MIPLAAMVGIVVGCRGERDVSPTGMEPAVQVDRGLGSEGELVVDIGARDVAPTSSSWVERYDPAKAWNGYLLVFYERATPVLIDMNGNVVHAWPDVRGVGRMRLTQQGDLVVMCRDSIIRSFDWHGNPLWEVRPQGEDFPHHDLTLLSNGNIAAIYHEIKSGYDYVLEFTPKGEIADKWHSRSFAEGHLKLRPENRRKNDPTHCNSLQEIPANQWFRAGDERFRPGNYLISARHLSVIFIVDRRTGHVAWTYDTALDWQHEAVMIADGEPFAGHIMVYNNGATGRYRDRESEVLQLDPVTCETSWRYRQKYFFAHQGGMQQPLPNGNVLIASGERLLEVTRDEEIVWQWIPPFAPLRPQRYSYAHCPQFNRLPTPSHQPIAPRSDVAYVDKALYFFAEPGIETETRKVEGKDVAVLRQQLLDQWGGRICRRIVIPAKASLELGYGLRAMPQKSGPSPAAVKFTVTARRLDAEHSSTVVEERVTTEAALWRSRRVSLEEQEPVDIELCLFAEAEGIPKGVNWEDDLVVWGAPRVIAAPWASNEDRNDDATATASEAEELRKRLATLGYVD